jgi:hypothetical protein
MSFIGFVFVVSRIGFCSYVPILFNLNKKFSLREKLHAFLEVPASFIIHNIAVVLCECLSEVSRPFADQYSEDS